MSDASDLTRPSPPSNSGTMSNRSSSLLRSSGDLVVDRRFLYARAVAAEGDYTAASDLLEQTLELAPDWAPLWLSLAIAREKLGCPDRAEFAYERAAALDADGALGVGMHLARIRTRPAPEAAPEGYVRALFDDYADRFEAHVTGKLAYRGPALLQRALERLGVTRFSNVVDLGCGTGLCGVRFRAASQHLAGVDLSPRMIEVARGKSIYDRLEVGANEDFLRGEPTGSASLVLAADVLVYVGDLSPILAAVRRVLEPAGHFAFTLQRAETGAYRVGSDLRFAHGVDYVTEAAYAAGFGTVLPEQATTRLEAGDAVPGLVVVATSADRG